MKSELCVGALARILDISKPAVSQHLKLLREAGLVRGEKIGYWTHYRVEKKILRQFSLQLHELIESQSSNSDKGAYICLRTEGKELDEERRILEMCKHRCEHPDKLKTLPEKCTKEQIKECHGNEKEHSCKNSCEKHEK